jgi:hypothetical protein
MIKKLLVKSYVILSNKLSISLINIWITPWTVHTQAGARTTPQTAKSLKTHPFNNISSNLISIQIQIRQLLSLGGPPIQNWVGRLDVVFPLVPIECTTKLAWTRSTPQLCDQWIPAAGRIGNSCRVSPERVIATVGCPMSPPESKPEEQLNL